MIPRSEWADPDRDRIYDLSEIIEILDYEIKHDNSLRSSTFKNLYKAFKKCALWIDDVNDARENIDLHTVLRGSGVDSFERLHIAFYDYLLYQSRIENIENLLVDINEYFDDYRSLDYEIEYD